MKIEFISNGDINDQLTNINVAKSLIEHETTYFSGLFKKEMTTATFEVEDLEEIASHLLTYCKYERMRQGYSEEQEK